MKKFTNYAPGPRGVTVYTRDKDGKPNGSDVIWIDPGKSASIDPKDIVEPLPDLGDKPGATDADEVSQVEALTAERDELKQQVADQGKELTALRADLEKATKPAK